MPTDSDSDGLRQPNFSERHGYAPWPPPIQLNDLDDRSRTTLWNFIHHTYLVPENPVITLEAIWMAFLGRYQQHYGRRYLADELFELVTVHPFNRVFDLLEFLMTKTKEQSHRYESIAGVVNKILENNRVGYRLVIAEAVITPIIDETELKSIETATTTTVPEVQEHMRRAIQLFADRDHPQFAKSISESMLAAEAAAQKLAGIQAPLGDAVDRIRKNGDLHGALTEGWKKLYGYTSQDGGIRHAIASGMVNPGPDLAQYFLVICSAFVNLCASAGNTPDGGVSG